MSEDVNEATGAGEQDLHQEFREYMGWGIRVGADGSIGYISAGNVGVRLERYRRKDYVITVSDPQSLVDYVEAARGKERSGEGG